MLIIQILEIVKTYANFSKTAYTQPIRIQGTDLVETVDSQHDVAVGIFMRFRSNT